MMNGFQLIFYWSTFKHTHVFSEKIYRIVCSKLWIWNASCFLIPILLKCVYCLTSLSTMFWSFEFNTAGLQYLTIRTTPIAFEKNESKEIKLILYFYSYIYFFFFSCMKFKNNDFV